MISWHQDTTGNVANGIRVAYHDIQGVREFRLYDTRGSIEGVTLWVMRCRAEHFVNQKEGTRNSEQKSSIYSIKRSAHCASTELDGESLRRIPLLRVELA